MHEPTQSAFVPGRQILDYIVIAHEFMHSLKNKKKGKMGSLTINLDMFKAYDRVEWSFLKAIMKKMRFLDKWLNWTMAYVISVTYNFNVNGENKDYVIFQRGITQGVPISHTYL